MTKCRRSKGFHDTQNIKSSSAACQRVRLSVTFLHYPMRHYTEEISVICDEGRIFLLYKVPLCLNERRQSIRKAFSIRLKVKVLF